jgi:hypothetical protein
MTIHLSSHWENLLSQKAAQEGTTPEALVLAALRDKYAQDQSATAPPNNQWESLVRGIGQNCGVSLSHEAVSSEGLYD